MDFLFVGHADWLLQDVDTIFGVLLNLRLPHFAPLYLSYSQIRFDYDSYEVPLRTGQWQTKVLKDN